MTWWEIVLFVVGYALGALAAAMVAAATDDGSGDAAWFGLVGLVWPLSLFVGVFVGIGWLAERASKR